ncbi:hypothetical protein V5799_023313 [Amblyomma americanum]|uniref:Protein kinase domain-containing protein n=1 Tax=Amblyomma americanum TaxID=6943 RepID=A0AAQ4FHW3_AMBAM
MHVHGTFCVEDTEVSCVYFLQSALGKLKRVYGVLLKNSGDLSSDTNSVTLSLNDCYQILKQKEGPDICKLRQQTESAQRNLAAGLQELQQVLLGVTADSSGKDFFLNDLDTSMAHFHISVEDEMSAYNLLFSDSHGLIATLVRRLVAALQDIIDQAASSSSVQSRYRSLLWEIFEQKESWHNIQQKAREASQLHKDLRKLKSALRHRLADFEDAEEDQEVAAKVAADINAIRVRILAAYIEQELLMVELCEAHNRRFPELAVLYPELDFPLHQKYNCLLKPDWDLYTFSVKKSGCVLKTTFANDDMIIAEYALDRPEDLDKLLVKASDYNLVSSPHLIRIKAVFQSKDQCHAYLLMPDIGTPMAELGRPVPHLVLQQVLSALSALHAKTPNKPAIPHGHIHPGWLLVPASDRPVCLGLPNFQLGKSYQLPLVDGIDFTAPELRYSNAEPTPASDMFAFGCLMLWVLYPEAVRRQSFPSSLDSVREMQQREKEDLVIIQSLVNKEPRLRPTTAELLLRPFFASLVSQHDTASGAPSFGMPT